MTTGDRCYFLDNLRTFLIFLVVLVHAGVVYEASGLLGPYWLVDDPATSNLPGLVNLVLDLFVMPTIFFIAGYFTPASLNRRGGWSFLKAKLRRLVLPWVVAVLTLMPLYKVIYLLSRGLPQEHWTTYLHLNNGGLGMSWLWFLPILFLFSVLFLLLDPLLARLPLPTARLPLPLAVAGFFVLSVASSLLLGKLGWLGWTKTVVADFQNERLLPYFLVFLLGSLCARQQVFASGPRSKKLFLTVCATAWIPVNVYVLVVLNYLLRPGKPIVSATVDSLVLWSSLYLSLLCLLYCAIQTFQRFFYRQHRLGKILSRLSYPVYIIHMIVMGPFALVLLELDLPGIVKYPILTLATYVASNLLALAYDAVVHRRAVPYSAPVSSSEGAAAV